MPAIFFPATRLRALTLAPWRAAVGSEVGSSRKWSGLQWQRASRASKHFENVILQRRESFIHYVHSTGFYKGARARGARYE